MHICKQTFCQVHRIGKHTVENLCAVMTFGILSCSDMSMVYVQIDHMLLVKT